MRFQRFGRQRVVLQVSGGHQHVRSGVRLKVKVPTNDAGRVLGCSVCEPPAERQPVQFRKQYLNLSQPDVLPSWIVQ